MEIFKRGEGRSLWEITSFRPTALPSHVDVDTINFFFSLVDYGRPRRRGAGGGHVPRPGRRKSAVVPARRGPDGGEVSTAAQNRLDRCRRRCFLASCSVARREELPQGLLRRSRAMAPAAPLPAPPGQRRQRRRRFWRRRSQRRRKLICCRRPALPSLLDDLLSPTPALAPPRAGSRPRARPGPARSRRHAVRVRGP